MWKRANDRSRSPASWRVCSPRRACIPTTPTGSTTTPPRAIEALLKEPGGGRRGGVRAGLVPHAQRARRADRDAARARPSSRTRSGKPMIVHVRDAWDDALRVLDEGSAERVVIHCFTGDADVARECARRGYWLSFAGNVTYPKNGAHARGGRGRAARSHPRRDRQPVPRAAAAARLRQCAAERPAHACRARRTCARSPSNSLPKPPARTPNRPSPALSDGERAFGLKVAVRVEGSVGWSSMRPEASIRPGSSPPSRFPKRPSPCRRRQGDQTDTRSSTQAPPRPEGGDRRRGRDRVGVDRVGRMGQRRDAGDRWARATGVTRGRAASGTC